MVSCMLEPLPSPYLFLLVVSGWCWVFVLQMYCITPGKLSKMVRLEEGKFTIYRTKRGPTRPHHKRKELYVISMFVWIARDITVEQISLNRSPMGCQLVPSMLLWHVNHTHLGLQRSSKEFNYFLCVAIIPCPADYKGRETMKEKR